MIGFLFDLLGWTLLPCVLLGWRWRLAWPLILLIVPLPVGDSASGTSLVSMLRGLFGGLSMTTVFLLLALVLQNKGNKVFVEREKQWLPSLIAIAALLFYPIALGWGLLDPYEWGHDEALVLPLVVGVLALATWLANWRTSAWALMLALVFWRLRLLESTNLWDYLLDPLLAFAVLGVLAARCLRHIRLSRIKENPKSSL
jgi:hypothetical protein